MKRHHPGKKPSTSARQEARQRPVVGGHLAAWLANELFDIDLEPEGSVDALDGRFTSGALAGKTVNCDLLQQIEATAQGQAPFAAIVGCIDSRVPPELVFDQRLGSVFAARIAGNFVNTDIVGSLEFATKVAGAKLIVVLGHSECGAIKGAIDNVQLGNLTATLSNIWPAVEATEAVAGERTSAEVVSTYRYEDHGLLVEQWVQVTFDDRTSTTRPLTATGAST